MSAYHYNRPIYPIALKAASPIRSWNGWPEDVVATLRVWNSGHLSFRRSNVFKCTRCELFCEPQPHGTCLLDGDWYCDDCIIALAREGHRPAPGRGNLVQRVLLREERAKETWRGGGVMSRRPPLGHEIGGDTGGL